MITAPSPDRARTGCVLVVEDDPTQRLTYAAMAGLTGLDVLDFPDAESVIAHLDTADDAEVALMVLDVDLGTGSGLDVLRWARGRRQLATVPVILLTGHDDVDARVAGLGAGANDYVGKPVHPRELRARIDAHLRTTTSWNTVLQDDLTRRAALGEAVAAAAVDAGPERVRDVIEALVADLPGARRAIVVPLTAAGTDAATGAGRDDGAVTAAVLAHHRQQGAFVFAHDDRSLACAPLGIGDRTGGLLLVERDRSSGVSADRLLASCIDAATVIAPVLAEHVLGPSALAVTHDRISRIIESSAHKPVFQPIVDLGSGEVVGYEGLTRFPDGRPDLVFADAARVGLSALLHRATVTSMLDAAAGLPDHCYVAINASPDVVVGGHLTGLLPTDRDVVVEITEHDRVEDYDRLVTAVRGLGPRVRLAVDDAGAGYSSLQHILSLRPDLIKLDRSLVAGLHTDPGQEAMVAGLVHFAGRTGARIVAEGIEDADEMQAARALGVDYGQGYHLGRPAPVGEAAVSRG
ncbi:EAL domain-containing protein [Euzebya rosea]|uniref:EAL domain-containing protein n=1 Tax=Euzebya rosea TaxID=2052804 RepID=UPI000D3E9FA3|nr:EAL domain-containing protein [Euzebya rosea]